MFKLTQTDHGQQSLVLFPRTKCLIREGMEAFLSDNRLDSVMRDDALQLKRHLEDPESEDKPVIFQKNPGVLAKCPDCHGTRNKIKRSDDPHADPEFIPCPKCQGEGQLYVEVIRKYYVPTEYHRRKLTR